MRMKYILAATAALSLSAISAAHADVIYTGNIASQNATNYGGSGANVVLNQYDTLTLPALNAIILTVTTSEAANVGVNNHSTTTDYGFTNATATVLLDLTGPGGLSNTLSTTATQASGTALANSITNFPGLTSGTTYSVTLTGANLAAYEGTGSVSLNFLALTGGALFGGTTSAPNNTLFFGGGANLGVNVMIDYQNVPEPASLAILGSAMLGMGLIRRRRNHAA